METLKKTAFWAGIVLTGLCGIVMLGGGKIISGTMLIVLTFVMILPLWRRRIPLWGRAGLLCAIFGMVIWNISTTDLPAPSSNMMVACPNTSADPSPSTGFKFLDQVTHIFNGFISQAESS